MYVSSKSSPALSLSLSLSLEAIISPIVFLKIALRNCLTQSIIESFLLPLDSRVWRYLWLFGFTRSGAHGILQSAPSRATRSLLKCYSREDSASSYTRSQLHCPKTLSSHHILRAGLIGRVVAVRATVFRRRKLC